MLMQSWKEVLLPLHHGLTDEMFKDFIMLLMGLYQFMNDINNVNFPFYLAGWQVVMQRPAKPFTPVRFRIQPQQSL